jgi:hypothetical protein
MKYKLTLINKSLKPKSSIENRQGIENDIIFFRYERKNPFCKTNQF